MQGERAADRCVVAIQIFRSREHGDVGAEGEDILQERRKKRIVDGKQKARVPMREGR